MIVCAHGDVSEFCKERDMVIVETHTGDIESYKGASRVLVTDQDMSENEYYFLKGKMLAKGIELVSTRVMDNALLSDYVVYANRRNQVKRGGGRNRFGFCKVDGVAKLTDEGRAVVKRIFELREKGFTYRAIREDEGVRHLDGRKLNISTIQIILQNRGIYEKEGL